MFAVASVTLGAATQGRFSPAFGRPELKVRLLEGLWRADDLSVFDPASEDWVLWRWTMICQPDDVPADVYDAAVAKMAKKLGRAVAARVRIERFGERLCAQLMHRGPYAGKGRHHPW